MTNDSIDLQLDTSAKQNANLAQSRVRWLSVTGVIGGLVMFIIATALLAWTSRLQREAHHTEDELMECRMAVNRVMAETSREWNQLLNTSPAHAPSIAIADPPTWAADLSLAERTCKHISQSDMMSRTGQTFQITTSIHLEFHQRAKHWNTRLHELRQAFRQQSQLTSELIFVLIRNVERVQGHYRLELALRLRDLNIDQDTGAFLKNLRQDCASDTIATRMRADVMELQSKLTRMADTSDVDLLTDLGENQIRPLLLRIRSAAPEFGFFDDVTLIEESIFRPHQDGGGGCFTLQLALAELLLDREPLIDQSVALTERLNNDRTSLATTAAILQSRLNSEFSNALAIVWSVIVTCGIAFSGAFVWLGRRVSEDISIQLETIDRSARELANEQLLLATVISSVPTPLYWKDAEGRYRGCSNSFANWLGFDHARDVIGRTDEQLPWSSETAEAKIANERAFLKDTEGFFHGEVPKTLADGRRFVMMANKTVLKSVDGRRMGVLGAYLDVTQRKAAEEKAIGLARIMAECPTEIYVFETTELNFIEMNRAGSEAVGIDPSNLNQACFASINGQFDRDTIKALYAPLLKNEQHQIEYETLHKRRDGTLYPVHVSVLTIELDGLFVFVACATDLTEYKKLERKLAQAQKLESIGQLAAGIAHEINTPMQCISGNIEFLQRFSTQLLTVIEAIRKDIISSSPRPWEDRVAELNGLMKKCRYEYLVQQVPMAIEESSHAISRVIEIVRAMRVVSHPGSKDRTLTDLNGLIRDAVTVSRNRWKYAAEVHTHFEEPLPDLRAFPAELSQVFINLIVNAADALVDKHGENPTTLGNISIRTSVEKDHILVELSDDGCGMSEETKAKAFEPFFTTKEVGKGTGQGLAITYDVVTKLHGGTIEIESEPGVGTQFKIRLPIDAQAKPPALQTENTSSFSCLTA